MLVSIIIPTYHRPDFIGDCLDSLLQNQGSYEIFVMDQSQNDLTERVVRAKGVPGLFYNRLDRRGGSAAKNLAIKLSKGESLLFTDDDCLVSPDWINVITKIFEKDREIGAVAGKVMPIYSTQAASVEPRSTWLEEKEKMFQELTDPWLVGGGSGNNLAIRRASLRSTGLFDEMLGPGVPLRSGEDGDMIYRLLKSGLKILYSPEVVVWHRAWRNRQDNLRLSYTYGLGRGGFLLKHVAAKDSFACRLYVKLFSQTIKRLFLAGANTARVEAVYFLTGLLLGQILMAPKVINKPFLINQRFIA